MQTVQTMVFNDGRSLTYKKGEIIQRPQDLPQGVYCISEGVVKAYSIGSDGEERIHVNYIVGEIFSLAYAVLDMQINVFYEAVTDCTLLRLPLNVFTERAKSSPEVSYTLFHQAVSQLIMYADRLYNLEHKYVSERLAYRLIALGKRLGHLQPDGLVLINDMTQRDIAHSIHVTPESLSREFDRLRRKGLITMAAGKGIVLSDPDGLALEAKDAFILDTPIKELV